MFDIFQNVPAWATSDEALAWYYGFALAGGIRLCRAGLRWFRRVDSDGAGSED